MFFAKDQVKAMSLLFGQKKTAEVTTRQLNDADRERFRQAKNIEATSWLSASAVRVLSQRGIDPARLMKCRFVLTWKDDESAKDGKK